MKKAILIKDLDTGTESFEEYDDFQRKPEGNKRHMEKLVQINMALNEAQDLAAMKLVIRDVIRIIEKS